MHTVLTRSVFLLLALCASECRGQYLVSAQTLAHRIPGRAAKQYELAKSNIREGNLRIAMDRLRDVLKIDPDYAEAHNAMGYCQLHNKDCEGALSSFQKAMELDPGSAVIHVNAAVALITMGQYAEAEKAARRAMALDPLSAEARYAVGETLLWQKKYTDEALDCFQRSEDRYPRAALMAGYVHFQNGRIDEAMTLVRRYLPNADTQGQAELAVWLKQTQRKLKNRY